MRIREIIRAIESFAPTGIQESWDNSGLQTGDSNAECTGVLLCVDVTPELVDEAIAHGCNLIVSHHPLIFKGLKSVTGATPQERALIKALRQDVSIYSSHTPLDSTREGLSFEMARLIGLRPKSVLDPQAAGTGTGLGVLARVPDGKAWTANHLIAQVRKAFNIPHALRCSEGSGEPVTTVALCSGAGGEFIQAAIEAGAQAIVTAEVRYHDFVDHGKDIMIIDAGHFETENCAKDVLMKIISGKFPNFAVYKSTTESNPVKYL